MPSSGKRGRTGRHRDATAPTVRSLGLRQLVDCFGCLSVWVAIPLAFFVLEGWLNLVMTWLALSSAAFLLERMSPESVVIEHVSEASTGELRR